MSILAIATHCAFDVSNGTMQITQTSDDNNLHLLTLLNWLNEQFRKLMNNLVALQIIYE